MTTISANGMSFREINDAIRGEKCCEIRDLYGERFIAAGMSDKKLFLYGTPGNALCSYLNGAEVTVFGNAQDAVGDTMNDGKIVVHGNIGDAAGYAMRGGKIFVKGSAGYRAGIHMKAYKEKIPVLIIGGSAGSFLGEYQAGGVIIVLGLNGEPIVGNFPCTGMHGGKMLLRSDCEDVIFPSSVHTERVTDLTEFKGYLEEYCKTFDLDLNEVLNSPFTLVTPDSSNPYKQMYVEN